MKKIGLMVVAVSLALSLAAYAGEKSANTSTQGAQTQTEVKGKRAKVDPVAALQKEIDQFKKDQKVTVDELTEIKTLATKEKATQTAAALDKLIAKHIKEFQTKIDEAQKKLDAAKKAAETKKTKKSQ
jgi:predicted  nucleic acid-binding Zn-ribbon protein